MQITEKFDISYFLPRSNKRYVFSDIQKYLCQHWHHQFIAVLKGFPENKFFVDMGLLLEEDRTAYNREGKPVPELSDLSFGMPVKIMDRQLSIVFGSYWVFGVGALQFSTVGKFPAEEVFKWLVKQSFSRTLLFGDVHFIAGGKYSTSVIRLSNARYLLYREQFLKQYWLGHKYWMSKNGGVSWLEYTYRS